MTLAQGVGYAVHVVVAAVWTGSVLFVAVGVLPPALRGDVSVTLLEHVTGRLTWLSRLSSIALLLTGLWQTSYLYSVTELTGTGRGHLVLGMVILWLGLTATVEVAGARLRSGLAERKIRTPAREARPYLYAAVAIALLLLVDAGLLIADVRVTGLL